MWYLGLLPRVTKMKKPGKPLRREYYGNDTHFQEDTLFVQNQVVLMTMSYVTVPSSMSDSEFTDETEAPYGKKQNFSG